MIGEQVAEWIVTGVLGQGSQGIVYEARHAVEPREAALKVLPPAFCRDPSRLSRFLDEGRAAAGLRHAGVIGIYGHGVDARGRAYLAMERLRGETLFERIRRGPLSVDEAVGVLRQICAALLAAHEHADAGGAPSPVVHRDLKPENVFLVPDGAAVRVVLVDFGIAKLAAEARSAVTLTGGGAYGTPAYLSPEQCRGEPVDQRTDLYALGCVLYEMLAGTPPFGFSDSAELLRAQCDDAPLPLREVAEAVPEALEAIALRLLAKRADERFASCRELVRALDAAGLAGRALAPLPRAPTLVAAEPGWRERAWRRALVTPPWLVGGAAGVGGATLLGLSIQLGVGDGFLSSPNWAFTYAVLVPLAVMAMLGSLQQGAALLGDGGARLGAWLVAGAAVLLPLELASSVAEVLRRPRIAGQWWSDSPTMGVAGAVAQGLFGAAVLLFVVYAVAWAQLLRGRPFDAERLAQPVRQLVGAGALVQVILYLSNAQYVGYQRGESIAAVVLPLLWGDDAPGAWASARYQSAITVVASAMVAGFLAVALATLERWPARGLGRGASVALLVGFAAATAFLPLGPVVGAIAVAAVARARG